MPAKSRTRGAKRPAKRKKSLTPYQEVTRLLEAVDACLSVQIKDALELPIRANPNLTWQEMWDALPERVRNNIYAHTGIQPTEASDPRHEKIVNFLDSIRTAVMNGLEGIVGHAAVGRLHLPNIYAGARESRDWGAWVAQQLLDGNPPKVPLKAIVEWVARQEGRNFLDSRGIRTFVAYMRRKYPEAR